MSLEIELDYCQPDFYRFSQDSIILAKHAAMAISAVTNVMDLCAGCGVVGLEFFRKSNHAKPFTIDFVELQPEFAPYLRSNIANFGESKFSIINRSFVELGVNFYSKYDLVLCNPPYFESGSGKRSDNILKDNCRFFADGSFEKLLQKIVELLNNDGSVFMVIRADVAGRIALIKRYFSNILITEIGKGRVIISTNTG